MKLLVATDAHIFRTPDGKHWSKYIYGHRFWKRYLNVFSSVRVVARVKDIAEANAKLERVDAEGVEIYGIPFYQGPKQLLLKYAAIQKALRGVSDGCDAALFRMPSQIAQMALAHTKQSLPIAGEIVYDPFDDLNKAETGIIIKLLNRMIHGNLKRFCKKANGVSYVTRETIQNHYPSHARLYGGSDQYFESSYSTITLSEDAFTGPRDYSGKKSLCAVLSDVAMNGERKGERTLIKAIKAGRDRGYDLRAIIIGDGSKRAEFEAYAAQLGIAEHITFTGLLPSSDAVREVMLKADVFVFPTQAEGLPRGILEAMAIGMPVLSTPVGGIPEVLDADCMFDPMDAEGFSQAMCAMLDNTEKMNQMSVKNYDISRQFENVRLQKIRDDFYRKLYKLCKTMK